MPLTKTGVLLVWDMPRWLLWYTRSIFLQNEVRKIVQYRSVVGESTALVHLNHLLRDSTAAAARVGWSTGGHTAINVPMYAFGPGSEAFTGVMDNTEVGLALQRALGLN